MSDERQTGMRMAVDKLFALQEENRIMRTALQNVCNVYCSWCFTGPHSDAGNICYDLKCIAAQALHSASEVRDAN